MKILTQNGQGIQRLYNRAFYANKKSVEEKVRRIIEDVRILGCADGSQHSQQELHELRPPIPIMEAADRAEASSLRLRQH